MNREDLNKKVSEIFDKETIDSLKKFSNHIDSQNADIIILIARKAICLFELFNYLGISKPKGEIVSDRILDLDAEYFKRKKVIVVDDTLIIGTTLKEIKEKLTNFNVDFQIFAFCVDRDNWQKDLIIPNYIEKYYSSQELLNFCILAVKAFSIVSMPYLVDFPITNFNSITKTEFENIVKSDKLTPIKLPVNEFECNKLYTFLLKSEIKEMFYNKVGDSFRNIVEIVKVRAFISIVDEQNYRIRLVPIVLLKPIPKKVINDLFFYLISFSESQIFKQLLITTKTRMRFIQYYLSVSLGQIFIENFANEKLQNHFIFKCSEIINIFGKIISVEYEKLLNENTILPFSDVIDFMPYDNYSDKFEDVFENIEVEGFNIVSSFQEIFANLFTKRELPARKELQDGNHNTHLKNRLINGISFEKISKFFCEKLQIGLTEEIREIFSICLDICNDLGVSIPIICNNKEEVCKVCNKNKECNDKGKEECNNNEIIYFRAYRHGELGKRTKGNVFLLNTFLEAFCESNGYDVNKGFDNVLLEKLAVLFYRVGVKNRFLEVTENYSDPTAINIGFYLMGAVLIENKPNEYFPNDYHDWFLMNHCYNLFKKQKVSFDTYKYFFNIKPTREGANTKEGAEFTARILGRAFGNAIKFLP